MPRRYHPDTKPYWEWHSDHPFYDAVMREGKNGDWVKYETFRDSTARLRAENARLRKKNEKLLQLVKGLLDSDYNVAVVAAAELRETLKAMLKEKE